MNGQEYMENRSRLFEKIRRGGNSLTDCVQWERFIMEGDDFLDFYEILGIIAAYGEEVIVMYDHHIRLAAATAILIPARNCIIKMRAERSLIASDIVFGEMNIVWYHDEYRDAAIGSFVDESAVLRWLA